MQFNGTPEEWEELVNKNKTSNQKQTAVEWLIGQIKKDIIGLEYDYADELKQAKEMEREQIITAWGYGWLNDYKSDDDVKDSAEQYYNEIYGVE